MSVSGVWRGWRSLVVDSRGCWFDGDGSASFGDVVTTYVGINRYGATEGNPVAEGILGLGGAAGMVAAKAVVMGASYASTRLVEEEYRELAPIMLATLGLGITVHNINVISQLQ